MPKRRGIPVVSVESRILFLRHERVILDTELAKLYSVSVKRLNEQVKRNEKRFPTDFMFRLTAKEEIVLRSQIATSKNGSGGRRYLPFAFTEHGAIMAATVLKSEKAVQMSLFVVRAFVRLREMLATNRRVASKIRELENRVGTQDEVILEIISVLKDLTAPPKKERRPIGFIAASCKAEAQQVDPSLRTMPQF